MEQTEEEARQGRDINQSLFALGECVRALQAGRSHVPFRRSQLTRVLQAFLTAPEAAMAVIATVSPAPNHAPASASTLAQAAMMAKV